MNKHIIHRIARQRRSYLLAKKSHDGATAGALTEAEFRHALQAHLASGPQPQHALGAGVLGVLSVLPWDTILTGVYHIVQGVIARQHPGAQSEQPEQPGKHAVP